MGKNYVRTEVRGAMRCSDTEPKLYHRSGNNELHSPSFVALSQPLDGKGDRAVEVFDFEMNAVNDMFGREAVPVAQGDIQHFELAQTAMNGDGTSYFTIVPDEIPSRYQRDLPSPMARCSLPEFLRPVVEMRTAITQAPAVSAGSFEDISMALMNSGNLGVATFESPCTR